MKLWVFAISFFFFVLGCQTPPTKVLEQAPVQTGAKTLKDILKDEPTILDVRSPFEFNANHVPGAINVRWEDFSQGDPKSRGLLQTDLFGLARRLALIGIDPDTTVLVLGKGSQGVGEEGRVAWTLNVLGVKKVMTVNVSEIRGALPREVPMTKNKPYWKPTVDQSFWVDIKTFKGVIKQGKDAAALVSQPVVIDVRSSQEYSLGATDKTRFGSVPAYNIEWTEFFNQHGAPVADILQKLQDKGISTASSFYIISNHGVRSAAVVYALRTLGVRDVTNVAGGYEQLGYLK